ncbi:hypothetical protein FT663_04228 [Candidozyma haemuli var. vulneris]|uniref:Ribosome quality control complex subunit 1 n=1 Tax=Candidozyma haemuli TaxID=45357 RepID=A0A2V1AYW6_9ASCO|nr:hypothetical protein CXQ85_002804 [[Candida] haemuloni]KAF3987948.1 hypothetical protein FT663_04228 [[Candida] haemuloni var. vulneris]KAF3991021.1 hypothetical protein FT662_01957 [[Candida] haemuloni var. vulneris]PVH23078.1 hypothetical protein CXQ85_002804 [[Candida] haemuloni]
MSSRALRRLERQRESATPEVEESASDNEVQRKPAVNQFAFLGAEGEEEVDDNEEEEETKAEEQEPAVPEKASASRKKNKKKNKKNKKQQQKESEEDDDDLDSFLEEVRKRDQAASKSVSVEAEDAAEVDDDFEAAYDDEDPPIAYTAANYLYFTTSRLKQSLPLLSVKNVKNLDPDNELKNLFGNLSLETIDDANSTTALSISPEVLAQFRKMARLTRGWSGKDRRSVPGTARKLLLSTIKDDYLPTAQKQVNMEELTKEDVVNVLRYKEEDEGYAFLKSRVEAESKLGIRYFKFSKVPSSSDRIADAKFYASVVLTPDPDALISLLQRHPYHIEALLQVAMVFLRQGNNKATSNALVEKCLFVFDRSFNKRFHELLQDGRSELIRLPYETFTNRQFYLCLFRIITGMAERSTFLTALNYCKLLWGLSPDSDPLGVRYFVDHYAILSEEYEWLVNVANSPLITTYSYWYTPGIAFSEVLALLHLDRKEEAKKSLRKAFSAHTYCAYNLLETIGLASNLPSSSDISKGDYIALSSETYLVRAPLLWKEQSHRQFLHDELQALFQEHKSSGAGSWLGKLFPSKPDDSYIPINLIRFAILSGENKVLAKVPEKIFDRDDVLEYDVLPPRDETVSYNAMTGVEKYDGVTDTLSHHLDPSVLESLIQNQSGAQMLLDLLDMEPTEPQEGE